MLPTHGIPMPLLLTIFFVALGLGLAVGQRFR
jgi:hypothetical protein